MYWAANVKKKHTIFPFKACIMYAQCKFSTVLPGDTCNVVEDKFTAHHHKLSIQHKSLFKQSCNSIITIGRQVMYNIVTSHLYSGLETNGSQLAKGY